MRIELFKGSGGWAWRIRAKNGNILATSRPYKGKRGRRNAMDTAVRVSGAKFVLRVR